MQPKRPLSVDGVQRRTADKPPYSGPGSAAAAAHYQQRPLVRERPFQQAPARAQARPTLMQRLQLPLLITGGMLAGFLVQSMVIGLLLISVYGVYTLARRVSSRISFTLSFMSLVTVMILLVAKPGTELAGNFATYTFLLLVIGVIALAIEAHPPKRRKRAKRPVRG